MANKIQILLLLLLELILKTLSFMWPWWQPPFRAQETPWAKGHPLPYSSQTTGTLLSLFFFF